RAPCESVVRGRYRVRVERGHRQGGAAQGLRRYPAAAGGNEESSLRSISGQGRCGKVSGQRDPRFRLLGDHSALTLFWFVAQFARKPLRTFRIALMALEDRYRRLV